MIKVNPFERPSVSDIMKTPHVWLRIKEKQLQDLSSTLERKRENLKRKEKEIAA